MTELQELAKKLGVSAQFRGALSSAEVIRELQMTRVFCLPSVHAASGDAEGFGIVLLEAEASGVPVVTSALGGAMEGIDDGVTGFAFAERDVDTLAARLITLLTDDALATSMAHAGPAFVSEKFDLYRCTEKLETLYDTACEAGSQRDRPGRIRPPVILPLHLSVARGISRRLTRNEGPARTRRHPSSKHGCVAGKKYQIVETTGPFRAEHAKVKPAALTASRTLSSKSP